MRRHSANQRKSDLVWDGRASWWGRDRVGVVPGNDSNLWMCAQDLGSVIGTHFRRLESRFGRLETGPVRLEACSGQLRDVLIEAVPYNQYREDLSGAITNFAEMVAKQLVIDGLMPFEVRGGWDRSGEAPHLEEALVVHLYPESLVKLGRWLFQVVPRDATDDATDARVVRLDPRRIVTFKPPRHYRRTLARMRSGFPLIGQSEYQWRMSLGKQKVLEDFKAVSRSYNVRRARLTAQIGWNGRGLFHDHIADFHLTCRQLQWQRFCIEVRDGILTTLARVFTMIGAWRGEKPRLVWEHLPSIEQVRAGESQLMSKGARFDEVLKPFMLFT